MRYSLLFLLAGVGSTVMFRGVAHAEVTAERSDRGVIIKIDGSLFTEQLSKAGQSPAMWPIIGPTGQRMTRSFPLESHVEGETRDHPHHQSLWFTHDNLNGVDFWKANIDSPESENGAQILETDVSIIESSGEQAKISTSNDWMNGNHRVLRDERVISFGTRDNGDRWIDFTIKLIASDGDVTIGDTKEGTFAMRVADSMRVEANQGGRIFNSEGQVNDDAWGMPAQWVDYSGPVAGKTVGIAIMSHPTSFRPVPRWHVRGYGLFAANPFGESDFPPSDEVEQGAVTIKNGDSLTLRYRVLLHRGATPEADIDDAFDEFAMEEIGE